MDDNHPDRALLDALREHTGMSVSEIARRAGIAASTLTRIYHGKTRHRMSAPTLDRIKDTFPLFFTDEDRVVQQTSDYLPVDILPSYAGMGGGGSGEGDVRQALISRRLIEEKLKARPSDLLLIDVRGDSMAPDFQHGDQILVDRRDTDPVQPGPFALWDGDGYVVKLVERLPQKRGWLRIFSINERYREYEAEVAEVRIMGRPVWYAREL